MRTIYYPQDNILEIRLSDKPVAREVSQDWNVNVSYAEDGSVVELVILDAVKAACASSLSTAAPICSAVRS